MRASPLLCFGMLAAACILPSSAGAAGGTPIGTYELQGGSVSQTVSYNAEFDTLSDDECFIRVDKDTGASTLDLTADAGSKVTFYDDGPTISSSPIPLSGSTSAAFSRDYSFQDTSETGAPSCHEQRNVPPIDTSGCGSRKVNGSKGLSLIEIGGSFGLIGPLLDDANSLVCPSVDEYSSIPVTTGTAGNVDFSKDDTVRLTATATDNSPDVLGGVGGSPQSGSQTSTIKWTLTFKRVGSNPGGQCHKKHKKHGKKCHKGHH